METILVIAHGTREPRGNAEAAEVARALEARSERAVRLAFLEHAEPSIPDVFARLAADGARSVVVLPMILTAAGHVKNDIPAAVNLARERHPALAIRIAGHLGIHSLLLDVLEDRRRACLSQSTDGPQALVVIGRGAADPDANAEIYKLGRLMWETSRSEHLSIGFMGVTTPSAEDAIRSAARALADQPGARIAVVPFFLFPGLLLERLSATAAAIAHGGTVEEIRVAAPIGPDHRLVETLLFRLRELEDGTGHLNCGTCLYRVPFDGREDEVGGRNAARLSRAKPHLGGRA